MERVSGPVLRVWATVVVGLVLATSLLALPPTQGASGDASSAPRRALGQRVELGAFVEGMTDRPSLLRRFERRLHTRVDVASYYWGFGDVFPGPTELSHADGGRRDVLLSWDMGPTRFTEWSAGEHDAYLDQIAEAARDYPYVVHVRPWPEMNGDWQDFQPTADGARPYGGTPAEFVAAWRHVVDHLRAAGVDNIRWVFNPTADTYAGTTHVREIWPGAQYVDVLGLDGFNWGRDGQWGRWVSFKRIFASQYRRLTRLHATAPVWICEVASKEPRRSDGAPRDRRESKAAWIRDMMRTAAFPRLTTLVWFQADKERDWRVDSSRGALRAMRRALSRRP